MQWTETFVSINLIILSKTRTLIGATKRYQNVNKILTKLKKIDNASWKQVL